MIEKGKPKRQPTARIQPQVTAIPINMNDRDLGSFRQTIGHDLNEPHPSNISVRASCYRF